MRKRWLPFLLLFSFVLGFLPASAEPDGMPRSPAVSAQSAILWDGTYGIPLWEKDADICLPMASTTKIMTALTAVRNADPDRTVTVPREAVGIEGSSVYLAEGEQLTLRQLLYALLLQSANDAATAIAIAVGGSVPEFAALMNREAAAMGLSDTHFENPHGLDAEEHYTTARELATITQIALQEPLIREIVSTQKATIPHGDSADARLLVNHNRLLRTYDGAIGVKTGFTKKSGRCLVSAAERDGVCLIAVTLNDPDDWRDHAAMLDYGFAQYTSVTLVRCGDKVTGIPVTGGERDEVTLTATRTLTLSLPQNHRPVTLTVEAPHFLFAPVTADREVGDAVYSCDLDGDGKPEVLGRVRLAAQHTVEQRQEEKTSLWQRIRARFGK